MPVITHAQLKESLDYNPETGVFIWLLPYKNSRINRCVGDIAGAVWTGVYMGISVRGGNYLSHRLAWFYVYGVWPLYIDHKDHDRVNNRINNLRSVTRNENQQNRSLNKNNTSGVTGVFWSKVMLKWAAKMTIDGDKKTIGYFTDKFEAICARLSANNKHGFHPNDGINLKEEG